MNRLHLDRHDPNALAVVLRDALRGWKIDVTDVELLEIQRAQDRFQQLYAHLLVPSLTQGDGE